MELRPDSLLGRWYSLYRRLGGDAHAPEVLPVCALLRRLLLWTPLRWLSCLPGAPFSPPVYSVVLMVGVLTAVATVAACNTPAALVLAGWFILDALGWKLRLAGSLWAVRRDYEGRGIEGERDYGDILWPVRVSGCKPF